MINGLSLAIPGCFTATLDSSLVSSSCVSYFGRISFKSLELLLLISSKYDNDFFPRLLLAELLALWDDYEEADLFSSSSPLSPLFPAGFIVTIY